MINISVDNIDMHIIPTGTTTSSATATVCVTWSSTCSPRSKSPAVVPSHDSFLPQLFEPSHQLMRMIWTLMIPFYMIHSQPLCWAAGIPQFSIVCVELDGLWSQKKLLLQTCHDNKDFSLGNKIATLCFSSYTKIGCQEKWNSSRNAVRSISSNCLR